MIYKLISLCHRIGGETMIYNQCIYNSNIPINDPYTHKFIKYCRMDTGHYFERFSELGYTLYRLIRNKVNPYISSYRNCYYEMFERVSSRFTEEF